MIRTSAPRGRGSSSCPLLSTIVPPSGRLVRPCESRPEPYTGLDPERHSTKVQRVPARGRGYSFAHAGIWRRRRDANLRSSPLASSRLAVTAGRSAHPAWLLVLGQLEELVGLLREQLGLVEPGRHRVL